MGIIDDVLDGTNAIIKSAGEVVNEVVNEAAEAYRKNSKPFELILRPYKLFSKESAIFTEGKKGKFIGTVNKRSRAITISDFSNNVIANVTFIKEPLFSNEQNIIFDICDINFSFTADFATPGIKYAAEDFSIVLVRKGLAVVNNGGAEVIEVKRKRSNQSIGYTEERYESLAVALGAAIDALYRG